MVLIRYGLCRRMSKSHPSESQIVAARICELFAASLGSHAAGRVISPSYQIHRLQICSMPRENGNEPDAFARMASMKLPRFKLRTLFVLVAIISIPMAWVAYQLNWIRQRHAFRANPDVFPFVLTIVEVPETPWQLKLLGEHDPPRFQVAEDLADEARRLFPGVIIMTYTREEQTRWKAQQSK